MFNNNFRTDIALETCEAIKTKDNSIDGVKIITNELDDIKITCIEILDNIGQETLGKPIGNYITIESQLLKVNDIVSHEKITKILSDELIKLHKLSQDCSILIVGLGNWNVTPDALGPKVISKVLVTRHIKKSLPQNLQDCTRSTCAISPGVMGITGIETAEIIKGICDKVKPNLVIAIDALAARMTSRINCTIQISDTGISPGAGLGNKRMTLCEETLGCKVICIGVPTVVDAATLVNDSIDLMLVDMLNQLQEGTQFYEMLANLEADEKYSLIKKCLEPYAENMFVTPKEVDEVIERLSKIIANALNIALHPGISKEDINKYI